MVMEKNETLKVAVLGMGQVAKVRHLEAYKRNPNTELVAVYDKNEARRSIAEGLGVKNFYSDLDEMYDAHNIDAVSICTPPFTHLDLTLDSLKRGKHVLCEKPIAMSVDDLKKVDEVKQDNLVFSTCHNFLYGKAMTKLKLLMSEEKLTKVTGVNAFQWSSWKRRLPTWYDELPGGLFYDEGPHLLYMIEYFIGRMEVSNADYHESNAGDNRSVNINAFYKGEKANCTLNMWFGAPHSEWFIAIGFEEGCAIIDLFRDILVVLPKEEERNYKFILEVPFKATIQQWSQIVKWIATRYSKGRHLYGHQTIIDQFVDAIIHGSEPDINYRDGYRIIGLMHDTLKSAGV
ncbi:Gfo/Idh/MocA family oxidoreductase [uncultured Amphritea sp.]|uniref:Gfo/Idh/MocA family protein n=1 Tax=uncultured Amphritea sp. TaxID=981605 RepID=UPI0026005626|nr:Gfo/Idh/MocA family oxidoreductase [uncultured Amphritea sp.]